MARGQKGNGALVREAGPALDQFKYQVAQQMGVQIPPDGYWGDIPARVNSAGGGQMVRQMIQLAERQLAGGRGAAFGAPAAPTPQAAPAARPAPRP